MNEEMLLFIKIFFSFDKALQASLQLSPPLAAALGGATDFDSVAAQAMENVFNHTGGKPRPEVEIDRNSFRYKTPDGVSLAIGRFPHRGKAMAWFAEVYVPRRTAPSPYATSAGWLILQEPEPAPEPEPTPEPEPEPTPARGFVASHGWGRTFVREDGRVFEFRERPGDEGRWTLVEEGVDVLHFLDQATAKWGADWVEVSPGDAGWPSSLPAAAKAAGDEDEGEQR